MSVMWRRLWIQVTADRKRFGLLCTTMAIGLLLWARLIVVSNLPRTAVAGEEIGASAPAPAGSKAARASAGSPSEKLHVALDQRPLRDPFVINPVHFPKPVPPPPLKEEPPKLQVEQADPLQALAKRTSQLLGLSDELRLEAVMGTTMAAINGKAVGIGEAIPVAANGQEASFTLVEVKQRSVILECEGRRFELVMSTPQK